MTLVAKVQDSTACDPFTLSYGGGYIELQCMRQKGTLAARRMLTDGWALYVVHTS